MWSVPRRQLLEEDRGRDERPEALDAEVSGVLEHDRLPILLQSSRFGPGEGAAAEGRPHARGAGANDG